MKGLCSLLLLIILSLNLWGCSDSKNAPFGDIIETYQYDITTGTVIPVKADNGLWIAEPFTVSADTVCVLTYAGTDGWTLNDTQQMGLDCHLENVSEETEGNFFIGTITNGQQNEAIPYNDETLGISLSFGISGEFYIYFMNTSSIDITVSDLQLWIQDEGEMDKYIF